jgi:hypothetical protein
MLLGTRQIGLGSPAAWAEHRPHTTKRRAGEEARPGFLLRRRGQKDYNGSASA